MRGKNTIVINGQQYDAVTGLPLGNPTPKQTSMDIIRPAKATPARQVAVNNQVRKPQRSQTLRRDVLKRPVGEHEKSHVAVRRAPAVVSKSPAIHKFAPHPQPITHTKTAAKDVEPVSHIVHKVHAAATTKAAKPHVQALSSRQLKEKLIAEKLATAQPQKHRKAPKAKLFGIQQRTASVVAACAAVVVLAGYLTYLNMPNLSMRVAAAQAGVDAKFPDYRPDGYRFNGPIAYNQGEVSLNFQSNSSNQHYEITQKNSSWDSQAVLDNYVLKNTKSYLTYSEQGLTVYTYGNKAAWVNGGVFYTVDGDAPLSNQQVLRIAASM